MDYQADCHRPSMKISGEDKIDRKDYCTPLMREFDRCKRTYAKNEEAIFIDNLQKLKQKGYMGQKYIRLRAYALTQIDILENAMRDAREELGVPDKRKLFRKEFAELEGVREYAMGDYVRKKFKRKFLWQEIGDTWHRAWREVKNLPKIELDAQKAESLAA
jgi:hypothetical protein